MDLIRLAWSRLRGDARRSVATFAAVAVAVSSFLVLAASTATQQATVTETAEANYRSAYDVLVRPKGSALQKERVEGLVRSNYLSGTFGGLTLDQLAAIRSIRGVEVAAPIAMLGYHYQAIPITVDAAPFLKSAGRTLLRWSTTILARNGTATAPGPAGYRYQTDQKLHGLNASWESKGDHDKPPAWVDGGLWEVREGKNSYPCPELREEASTPFQPEALWDGGRCLSTKAPELKRQSVIRLSIVYPMLIAAIDPTAEAALVGLDRTVLQGRYLDRTDTFRAGDSIAGADNHEPDIVPAMLAGSQAADYQLRLRIDRLPDSVSSQLGAIAKDGNRALIESAKATSTVAEVTMDAAQLYAEKVPQLLNVGEMDPDAAKLFTTKLWRPADVAYQPGTPLRPVATEIDPKLWQATFISQDNGFEQVPFTAQDTSYRDTTAYTVADPDSNSSSGTQIDFDVVGTYDPTGIREFSGLSAVPLETYTAPELVGADDASTRALGDQPMRSDLNIGGYLQQTPALLIPLDGLKAFRSDRLGVFDPDDYSQTGDFDDSAPISAIRIRVAGVTGMDQASRQRIADVVAAITEVVDTDVDITAGSSPELLPVTLPATTLGSPALNLSEPWSRKGVALQIVDAVDAKSLLLFALILVSSGLTVAISAGAAVRARRKELGILAAIGWSPGRRRRAVLAELAILGGAAGLIGAIVAWPLALAAQARFDWLRAAIAVPGAVLLTLAAGGVAAWRSGTVRPIDALRPLERAGGRQLLPLRGGLTFGLTRILRRPGRALLGSVAIALGVAPLLVLIGLERAFRGRVVGTLLGNAVAVLVRPQDLVASVVLAVLGLVAVSLILFLNLAEDSRTYASLQAIGWRQSWLARSLAVQALTIVGLGTTLGLAGGLGIMIWLTETVPTDVIAVAATIATSAAVATLLAALIPAAALRRLPTARLLAEE
jgi:hypothetical protein